MLSLLACLCMAAPKAVDTDVVVLAAASLRKPFLEMQAIYEQRNPGTHLQMSFAGSQQLANQLNLDAPGDAFFSADKAQMDAVVKAGKIGGRDVKPFAGNRICLLVSERAKNRVTGLQDLTNPGIRICVAGDKVPAGAYTTQVLVKAAQKFGPTWLDKVRSKIVSFETSVSAVVTRVELNEVDAGFVYETDARQAKKANGYEIPKDLAVRATYYCGVLKGAKNPAGAKGFVALVLGKEGQAILAKYGFLPPK